MTLSSLSGADEGKPVDGAAVLLSFLSFLSFFCFFFVLLVLRCLFLLWYWCTSYYMACQTHILLVVYIATGFFSVFGALLVQCPLH